MNIFISWSGARSKAWAEALCEWLPQCIQALRPWISSHDIDKGARWGTEVAARLQETSFGIVCLTPENLNAPWINFEAGSISKVQDARVCTLLIDLTPSDVGFPLAQFQATIPSKEDVFRLLQNINAACALGGLSDLTLTSTFEVWWPKLEERVRAIHKPTGAVEPKRPDRELLEEILSAVRNKIELASDSERRLLISAIEAKEVALHNRYLTERILQERPTESIDYVQFANALLNAAGIMGAAWRNDGNGFTRIEIRAFEGSTSIEFPTTTSPLEAQVRIALEINRFLSELTETAARMKALLTE